MAEMILFHFCHKGVKKLRYGGNEFIHLFCFCIFIGCFPTGPVHTRVLTEGEVQSIEG